VIWVWRVEARRWVRNLSLLALGAVILQCNLGGLTVI
jgi:heme A synthase